MKFILGVLTTLLAVSYSSFGQFGNNPKLDQHRSFKEIKLSDTFDRWSKQLTYRASNGDVKQYVFDINYCCNTIFEFEAELVTVLIQDNKIVSIKIDLKKFQESQTSIEKGYRLYESIESQFNTLFGKHYASEANMTNPMRKSQWIGNKTVLETRYNYYGVMNGDRAEVKISDLDFLMNNLKSGF